MDSNITKAVIKAATAAKADKNTEDYYKDGVLVCGKCHTNKEKKIQLAGECVTVRCICKCESEERERIQKQKDYEEEMRRIERLKVAKDMTSRHIKIAVQLQNKALEALQRVKVEDMSPRDIREYIKLATDLERLNRSSAATDNELEAEETTSVDIYMPEKEEDSHE